MKKILKNLAISSLISFFVTAIIVLLHQIFTNEPFDLLGSMVGWFVVALMIFATTYNSNQAKK